MMSVLLVVAIFAFISPVTGFSVPNDNEEVVQVKPEMGVADGNLTATPNSTSVTISSKPVTPIWAADDNHNHDYTLVISLILLPVGIGIMVFLPALVIRCMHWIQGARNRIPHPRFRTGNQSPINIAAPIPGPLPPAPPGDHPILESPYHAMLFPPLSPIDYVRLEEEQEVPKPDNDNIAVLDMDAQSDTDQTDRVARSFHFHRDPQFE